MIGKLGEIKCVPVHKKVFASLVDNGYQTRNRMFPQFMLTVCSMFCNIVLNNYCYRVECENDSL